MIIIVNLVLKERSKHKVKLFSEEDVVTRYIFDKVSETISEMSVMEMMNIES